MPPVELSTVRNRLLAALPADVLARLLPRLRRVEMPFRRVLSRAGEPVTAVHFPETGWVSILVGMGDGDLAEVGLVGNEGMVGLPLVLGGDRHVMESMVQSGGTALTLDVGSFRRAMDESPALRDLLLRYALAFQVQVSITAACNVRHPLRQRLASWLLMSRDRAEGDEFPITHEFLSLMLGVRRAGVTVEVGKLREAGLIQHQRGRTQILDWQGLEAVACACRRVVRHEYGRLLGPTEVRPIG